jgi:heavy metal efflux system protein
VIAMAIEEVARPVAFSVLVIAVILVPLYALEGVEGKMFAPLATTMLIALLVSLAVALTVVPVLASTLLKQEPEKEFELVRRLHAGYVRLLRRAIARPRRTLAVSAVLLVLSTALVPLIGTEFMPPLDEGSIAINVVRLPDASLAGSVNVSTYMEQRLREFPEVEAVVSKTGRAEISEDPMGPEQTDVFVMLKPRKAWASGRDKAALVEAIRKELSDVPGLRLSFSQPIALRVNELISGVKSDLAVKVFGPDLEVLKRFADRIGAAVGGVRGAGDVKVEQVSGMPQYDLEIDREAAARHGIRVGDVNDTIETAIGGRVASTLIEGQRRFAITVRFPEEHRKDIAEIGRLLVAGPDGRRVPLAQLAKVNLVEAPAQVSRENGMRRVVVEANVRGRDLGGFVEDVRARIQGLEKELPPGYYLRLGGQFENQERAMQRLAIVVPVALALVFLLLYLALGSVAYAALVLLNLPFALVGGVIAVVLFRMPLSVSAAVAFIVLLGIAVQNGVVLVAFFKQLRERGLSVADTVEQGCSLRFRPLLMTALTSFIGHLPMLYATGSGADIQRPLAVVVMGGLVTSTLLTLLVLPTLYAALAGRRQPASTAGPTRLAG